MKFKVGEQALLVRWPYGGPTENSQYFGTTVTVTSQPIYSESYVTGVGYEIRANDGFTTDCADACLRKIPPREELVSWDKCVWQPTKEHA